MMNEYMRKVQSIITSCPLSISSHIEVEFIDINMCYFKASMKFVDNTELHLFELVTMKDGKIKVEKYRYLYQDKNKKLIKRWDNARHHPEIDTFPNHIHFKDRVEATKKLTLEEAVNEICRKIEE